MIPINVRHACPAFLSLMMSCCLWLPSQAQPPADAIASLNQAQAMLTEGQYVEAGRKFGESIEQLNQSIDFERRQNVDKNTQIDFATYLEPLMQAYAGRADAYVGAGDLDSAMGSYYQHIEQMCDWWPIDHPMLIDALAEFGSIKERAGRFSEAHLAYRWAAEAYRTALPKGDTRRIVSAVRLGRFLSNITSASNNVELTKEEAVLWLDRAYADGQIVRGESRSLAVCMLALTHADQGRFDIAIKVLDGEKTALNDEMNDDASFALEATYAEVAFKKGDPNLSLKHLENLKLIDDPIQQARLHTLSAQAKLKLGDLKMARSHAQDALKLIASRSAPHMPRIAHAYIDLGDVYGAALLKGKYDKLKFQLYSWAHDIFSSQQPDLLDPLVRDFYARFEEMPEVMVDPVTELRIHEYAKQLRSRRESAIDDFFAESRDLKFANPEGAASLATRREPQLNRALDETSLVKEFYAPSLEMMQYRARKNLEQMQGKIDILESMHELHTGVSNPASTRGGLPE